MTGSVADRLTRRVDHSGGPGACWPFTGYCRNGSDRGMEFGHGRISVDGRLHEAHRVAWSVAHGRPVPDGMLVLHHCDFPPCCNPAHLYLGTHTDNVRDRERRGRARHLQGAANGRARLTADQVAEIRRRRAAGGVTLEQLGAQFGVTKSHVSKLVRRLRWTEDT